MCDLQNPRIFLGYTPLPSASPTVSLNCHLLLAPDHQVSLHSVGILTIGVVLGLDLINPSHKYKLSNLQICIPLESEGLSVEVECGSVTFPHVEAHVSEGRRIRRNRGKPGEVGEKSVEVGDESVRLAVTLH